MQMFFVALANSCALALALAQVSSAAAVWICETPEHSAPLQLLVQTIARTRVCTEQTGTPGTPPAIQTPLRWLVFRKAHSSAHTPPDLTRAPLPPSVANHCDSPLERHSHRPAPSPGLCWSRWQPASLCSPGDVGMPTPTAGQDSPGPSSNQVL